MVDHQRSCAIDGFPQCINIPVRPQCVQTIGKCGDATTYCFVGRKHSCCFRKQSIPCLLGSSKCFIVGTRFHRSLEATRFIEQSYCGPPQTYRNSRCIALYSSKQVDNIDGCFWMYLCACIEVKQEKCVIGVSATCSRSTPVFTFSLQVGTLLCTFLTVDPSTNTTYIYIRIP